MQNKKTNFKRVAENRTNKIIDQIRLLDNLSNCSYYEYTDDQITAIFNIIQKELDCQKAKLITSNNKKRKKIQL